MNPNKKKKAPKTGKNNKNEKKREKFAKALHIINIIKSVLCWSAIAVLAVMVISFLIIRARGGTPSIFGYTVHKVETGSMQPELMVEDIILSKDIDDPTSLKVGEIITFQGDSKYNYNHITHRVYAEPYKNEDGVYYIQTKGDANEIPDPEIPLSTVESVFITKIEILKSFYKFFLSPWGLIVFVGSLLIIFFDEVINIARILTDNYPDDDKDENISDIIKRIQREDEEKAHAEKKKKRQEKELKKKLSRQKQAQKKRSKSSQSSQSSPQSSTKTNSKKRR